jgi:hypothetical protein
MHRDFETELKSLRQFDLLRAVVTENIGYFPQIRYDRTGRYGHRTQIFDDGVELEFSERAIARHIELGDIVLNAYQRKSRSGLVAGMCLMFGGELLRNNSSAGLAFVARALRDVGMRKLPHAEIIGRVVDAAKSGASVIQLVNLLLPLAHEIGHLPESQALCPKAILGDDLLETYRINYNRARSLTGEFDYASSFNDSNSRLNLALLREEAASDFFSVACMSHVVRRTLPAGADFPIAELAFGILLAPVVTALEEMFLKDLSSKRELQELILVMQCRFSLMVDSLRACVKTLFHHQTNYAAMEPVIDAAIDGMTEEIDKIGDLTWEAFRDYIVVCRELRLLDEQGVLDYVGRSVGDANRSILMADYLDRMSEEMHGYPISVASQAALNAHSEALRTFDAIILAGDKVIAKRRP